MFGLFRKNMVKSGLLEGGMDCHSHILFGVDDGARTMEESLLMIEGLKSLGFRGAYCTPHIMARYPKNTSVFLRERFDELKEQVRAEDFDLRLAAEYMLDEQFLDKLDKETPLTYDGKRILVELPQISLPRNWQEMVFQIKSRNLIPVFAHPERYWHLLLDEKDRDILLEGSEFQLNLLSLSGMYGQGVRRQAFRMLNEEKYSHWGTDLHRVTQIRAVGNIKLSSKYLKKSKEGIISISAANLPEMQNKLSN